MSKRINRLARGLLVGTMLTVYQAPGCNFALDESTLLALFESAESFGDFKFEFEVEGDSHGHDDDEGHGDSDFETD